ncbi:MAG TPA: hypothetical protein VHE55_08350 [Fimbriimonadaceae bacterium]|nr:hypothetical protein [Fimbriimonadaceae bacterium]
MNTIDTAVLFLAGIFVIIGFANLIDFGLRTMAENKAERAELCRFRRWGLPAPKPPAAPPDDEHLWHF